MGEIIYVCKSVNNKNVRQGELEILRKSKQPLCFEFGVNEMNIKKRFYENEKDFEEDFNALMKIKENSKKIELTEAEEVEEDDREERFESLKRKSERPRRNPYSRKYDDEY